MQLTTLIVLALLPLLQPAVGTTTRAPPAERVTTRAPLGPLCKPPPPVCNARSPRVCGRLRNGLCRRFWNVCELMEVSRRDISPSRSLTWTHTNDNDCRTVRRVGARYANWCHLNCPRRPVPCRRTPRTQQMCVRSRDRKLCRMVANACHLRNNNCFMRPRNNWMVTRRSQCGLMKVGDRARPCKVVRPTRDPIGIIRPVLPSPETSVAPVTTTGRPTTARPTTARPTTASA